MKATKLTKKELETIAQLNAQAEERRRMAEDEKRRAELKKKYERSERQRAYYLENRERILARNTEYRRRMKAEKAAASPAA